MRSKTWINLNFFLFSGLFAATSYLPAECDLKDSDYSARSNPVVQSFQAFQRLQAKFDATFIDNPTLLYQYANAVANNTGEQEIYSSLFDTNSEKIGTLFAINSSASYLLRICVEELQEGSSDLVNAYASSESTDPQRAILITHFIDRAQILADSMIALNPEASLKQQDKFRNLWTRLANAEVQMIQSIFRHETSAALDSQQTAIRLAKKIADIAVNLYLGNAESIVRN